MRELPVDLSVRDVADAAANVDRSFAEWNDRGVATGDFPVVACEDENIVSSKALVSVLNLI